jgi:hypothetical protein
MIDRLVPRSSRLLAGVAFAIAVAACTLASTPEEHVVGRGDPPAKQAVTACPQFEPGTNMLLTSWGEDPEASAKVATVVQIIGDSAAGTSRVVSEVFDACSNLAAVLGKSPDSPSIPPTLDEARGACEEAIDGVEGLQEADLELTTTVEAISTPCDAAAAVDDCMATCEDGETCLDFCTSAVSWTASCPDAAVFITFSKEVGESYVLSWEAVEESTGAIIAARSRLALANESLSRLASIPSTTYRLPESCVPRVIDTLGETTQANDLTDRTIDGFLDAIEVRERAD